MGTEGAEGGGPAFRQPGGGGRAEPEFFDSFDEDTEPTFLFICTERGRLARGGGGREGEVVLDEEASTMSVFCGRGGGLVEEANTVCSSYPSS